MKSLNPKPPLDHRTGQGKTLAFVLPIVERLLAQNQDGVARKQHGRLPRVIVLAPTRELAKQVGPPWPRCSCCKPPIHPG